MSGPLPKHPSQRRRRNQESRGVQLPIGGRSGPVPALAGATKLLPSTRELWRELWRSPMALTWLEVDAYPLRRLVGMVDARERGNDSPSLAAEIRQLEDRFGLSPVSRRRLAYEIHEAGSLAELRAVPDEPGALPVARRGGDPRLLDRQETARERMARLGLLDAPPAGVITNGRTTRAT